MVTGLWVTRERSRGCEVTMTSISTGKGFILLEAQENKDRIPGVMQASAEGAMGGRQRRERHRGKKQKKTKNTFLWEACWAEELMCKDVSIQGSALIGALWCERGMLSISGVSICPVNLCAPPQLISPLPSRLFVFSVFSLSLRGWRQPYITHWDFFFFFPFVCALLTFDILLDLLAEWPRGFSFCKKRKRKESSSEWKKHIQKQRKQQFSMHVNSRTVRTGACLRIILVMLCLGCVERSSDCSFDMIHIWLFETEQEIYARGINGIWAKC